MDKLYYMNDERLSWGAKGLLAYIENDKTIEKDLDKSKINDIFKELIEYGYIVEYEDRYDAFNTLVPYDMLHLNNLKLTFEGE